MGCFNVGLYYNSCINIMKRIVVQNKTSLLLRFFGLPVKQKNYVQDVIKRDVYKRFKRGVYKGQVSLLKLGLGLGYI